MIFSIFFILLVILIISGLPLFTCFAIILVGMMLAFGYGSSWVIPSIFYTLNSFMLLAIPFFILAGALMDEAKISERIVDFANTIVGRIKGGLGAVTIVSCGFFGAITGSSAAAISAIGVAVLPELDRHGYDRRYSTGLLACAGVLGQLIPPSIPLVVFGMITFTSVAAAWLGAAVPGLILIAFYLVINHYECRKSTEIKILEKVPPKEALKQIGVSFWRGIFALLMPFIILGGVYSGIFTPTEAAAVSVVYVLIVGLAIYRTLNLKSILYSATQTISILGSVMLIVMIILALSKFLTFERVPVILAEAIISISQSKIITLLLVNLLLLIVGMLVDDFSGMLIMAPLLYPLLVKELGLHPVHMAALMAVNQGTGMLTPPVATNLFIASRVGNVPVAGFIKHTIPFFLFGNIPVLLMVTFIPEISLWLPSLFYPQVIP